MSGPLSNPFMFKSAAGAAGNFYSHQIANSARFIRTGDNANTYLKRTPSSAGNRKTYTLSLWVKRTQTTTLETFASAQVTSTTNYVDGFKFGSAQYDNSGLSLAAKGTLSGSLITSAAYRDTSAWMHIVIRVDSTQGTAANRFRLYVNGEQVTAFSTETYIAEDYEGGFCSTREHAIGWGTGANNGQGFFGYMAEVILADGTSYAPTQFGESKNGVWIPKDPDGTSFGTTGFHLDFADSSALGNDVSGNNNDFTNVGMATHDQMKDTPTFNSDSNGGNFCTYNPLQEQGGARKLMTLSEGNLHAQSETADKYHQIIGNMGVKTGKWYIEWYIKDDGYPSFSVGWHHGDGLTDFTGDGGYAGNMQYMGYFTGSNVYISGFGVTDTGNPQVAHSSFTNQGAPATDDIIMCAIDMDAGKCWWGINGVWGDIGSGTGNPATGANASATWTIANYPNHKFPFTLAWANPDTKIIMNCGQEGTFAGSTTAGGNADDTGYGNFKYDVPAGFLSLCTGNLPVADAIDPAQTDDNFPQKLFNAIAYSGDGGGSQTIGFQPDLVWVKRRNGDQGNGLFDSTRGTTKVINSDATGAEATSSGLTSFNSTGYTMGEYYNQSGNTYVSWSWRANGGTTATNSNGSVDSTVQVDPSSAFSIATFRGGITSAGTGTVGHGLSKAPSLIIFRGYGNLGGGDGQWWVGSDTLTSWNYYLRLNTNALAVDKSGNGSMSAPTSTVFSINNTDGLGYSTIDTMAYSFADIEGYCKTGSYGGNGNAVGPYVYTGFRPALVVTKRITGDVGGWLVHDDARNPGNPANLILQWNASGQEFSGANDKVDMLSNGFKVRSSNGGINASGSDYLYIAMAHNPFKYATAR